LCIQSMFLFTNYVPDPQMRYDMGQKVLYLVACNIVLNLLVLLAILIKKICSGVSTWKTKRKNKIE